MAMIKCNPVTGVCQLPEQDNLKDAAPVEQSALAVHYIGDPMCSWCWGISPTVNAVAMFCAEQGIDFTITMGGLRAGGGDAWNENFKTFLRSEWSHIEQTTGQPFGYALLDLDSFNYDTEPACRAVTAVKLLQLNDGLPKSIVLKFFSALQQKFYVQGQDPKLIQFYASICDQLGIDFSQFKSVFLSTKAQQAVQQEFLRCREWGVRAFPTLLLQSGGELKLLSQGYVSEKQIFEQLS